jgi:hypothetical protein
MKYLILIVFSAVTINNSNLVADCFDYAVDSVLEAELVRGSAMDDEEAFNNMNWALTTSMAQN